MFDFFWEEITKDLAAQGITFMQMNKHLTELQHMFFGNSSKLDEAIQAQSETDFKQALKRNVFLSQGPEVGVDSLYTYMMEAIYTLQNVDSEDIMSSNFV